MFWRKKNEPERQPAASPVVWPQPEPPQPEPEQAIFEEDWQGNVVLFRDDGTVACKVSSVPEAKLAIKQLRLRKKAVGLEKREVTQAITAINAERRVQVANQGRMMRGGGNLGKFTRSMQAMGRDAEKRQHAARLQPYEQEKARLDLFILNIDRMIAELEAYILQHSD